MPEGELCDKIRFFTNIRNGNDKAVGDVIHDNKEISPFNNDNGESAAAVALNSKQLAVYEALISKGWCLNYSEDFNEIVNKSEKKLRKELREIHEKFTRNPEELTSLVDTFLDRNRYVLPNNYEEGKAALANKIRRLIPERKNIKDIANQFHEALKTELREIHKRNFIENPNDKHLISLITRTGIYFGGSSAISNRRNYLNLIAGAYEELNKEPEIRAILKFVVNIKSLKIIFDFDRDSIEHADPTENENVQGKAYAKTGEVYIGAKALNNEYRSEVLGVLAHELCHVAIFYIYNNEYKPYHKDDLKSEKEFENVLKDCQKVEKRCKEYLIELVLNGPENLMQDELCVRVPHLLASYQEDYDKINFLKKTFKMLFDYFEMKTLPDLDKEIDLMSAVWELKSKEPQHLTDSNILFTRKAFELDFSAKKILEILSNCPQVTMNWIFQEMMNKTNCNFLFIALKHLKDKETYKLVVKAHSSCMKPLIVIDCDNELETEIEKVIKKTKIDKINDRIIFIHNHKKSLTEKVTLLTVHHSWHDLEEQSKENLIKRMINFQGEKTLLEEVVDRDCDALDFVSLKELLDNSLKIGNDLKFPEIDIYVKRIFLSDKSDLIETSQILNIAETSKFILLSDDPGMGKTTELKMLTMELKKKLKTFWVAFVDLKEHSEFYEKDQNFKFEFNSPKEIANFFAKKIFKLNEFEEKVFGHLFCCDRIVLLLDGFDEISPSFKKFVTMLIKSIRKFSKIILITSTRPHLKEELCDELKVEAYKLMPLTMKNCEEILKRSFEKFEIFGEDLKKKLDQTKIFFRNLNKNSEPLKGLDKSHTLKVTHLL